MSIISNIKRKFQLSYLTLLIKKGNYNEAIKHLENYDKLKRVKLLTTCLGFEAIDKLRISKKDFIIEFTKDENFYERFLAVNDGKGYNDCKAVLYIESEDKLRGLENLIKNIIDHNNPMIKYLEKQLI